MRLRPWRAPTLRPEPLARAVVVGDLVRTAIEREGSCTWRAWGSSMAPSVNDGDVLRLVAPAAVHEGDVVMAMLDDEHLVVHRVRAIDEDGSLHLRGDSCRQSDPVIDLRDVIAKVTPTPPQARRSVLYDVGARLTSAGGAIR